MKPACFENEPDSAFGMAPISPGKILRIGKPTMLCFFLHKTGYYKAELMFWVAGLFACSYDLSYISFTLNALCSPGARRTHIHDTYK